MLSSRLRELLSSRKISKEDFANMCDLPLETIRNIYYGKTPDPKISTVMKMANALGIGVNCLMGQCEHTPEERALLQHFRSCGHHGKNLILISSKYEALTAKEERESFKKHRIPCLIPHGDIYHGIVYDDCQIEEIFTTIDEADVSIKMTNNCLMPVYCKDDIILIARRFPTNNEYGVFYYNGKAYIRQYIECDARYILKCLHKYDADMVFKRMDEIEWMGTCCGVIRT